MAPFYRGYDPVFRLDSDDIQVHIFVNFHKKKLLKIITYFYRVFKHFMAVELAVEVILEAAAMEEQQVHQRKPQKHQLYCEMMTLFVKIQRLMPYSIHQMAPHMLSKKINITN
jgi:hypothetical protein